MTDVMAGASSMLAQQAKEIKDGNVEQVMDSIQNSLEDAEDVNQAFTGLSIPGMDEFEGEEELNRIMEADAASQTTQIANQIPAIPSGTVYATPAAAQAAPVASQAEQDNLAALMGEY